MGLRFAVDTGGTFTDLMVADENGVLSMFKASTTPSDPVAGVIESLRIAAHASGEDLATYLARGDVLSTGQRTRSMRLLPAQPRGQPFSQQRGTPTRL